MPKGARPKERVVTNSRPESRMDEAPRARGRFNLDREAREHMSEGLEVWIPNEETPSLHSLEAQPIRPLMDVELPGYTPTSTSSGSQMSGGSSRLKELHERLQQNSRENSAGRSFPQRGGSSRSEASWSRVTKRTPRKDTTGTIGWIGIRNRGPGEIVFMMQPGWKTSRFPACQKARFT